MIDITLQQPYALLILIPLAAAAYYRYTQIDDIQLLHITRLLIITTAILAISQPVLLTPYQTNDRSITLLQDNSESSQLIQYSKPQTSVQIQEKIFDSQNPETTSQELLNSIEEDQTYLISSDLQLNHQQLRDGLRDKNATLYLLEYEMEEESSISIEGPDESYIGADNRFDVNVHTTSEETPEPTVMVEGEEIRIQEDDNGYYFNYTFNEEGRKQIQASIQQDDQHSQNNEYYKVVDIQEKPDVLYVNQRIDGSHNSFLDTQYVEEVPDSTDNFDTLVINSEENTDLEQQIIEGQNVLYTGPAAERNYLPVRPTEDETQQDQAFDMARVAIVIDISVSNSEDIRDNKAIALNTLDGLSSSSEVALIAYNDNPYLLSDLTTVQNNRESLKNEIKSIDTQGPTDHAVGLKAGKDVLNDRGNVIMITDGGLKTDAPGVENVRERTLREAANSSITINVVDSKPNVNPDFLKEIAELSNGIYTSASGDGPLSFVFDSQESESQNKVATVDSSHPITSNHYSSIFTEVDPTTEKNAAQTLMRSENGLPYLTTWHYGIGRVAAITDQDVSLTSVSSQDPQMLLNVFQWLSSSNQEEETSITGKRMPDSTYITSSQEFEGAEQLSPSRFVKTENYNETGFKTEADTVFSYNYPQEIQEIGYSEEIEETVNMSGGQIIKPDSGILPSIASQEVARSGKEMDDYIIALLAFLLLAEVGYRKRKRYI